LRDLFARGRWELALAAIVIAAELTLGVPHGIALGVVLSLLMLIYRTSHPQGAVLGQLPGEEAYRDVRRHPEALIFPGLLIWRAGGDLFFASIGHFDERLKAARRRARSRRACRCLGSTAYRAPKRPGRRLRAEEPGYSCLVVVFERVVVVPPSGPVVVVLWLSVLPAIPSR
jgi:hypothetical protein